MSPQLQALLSRHGAAVVPLEPLGAEVTGLNLRQRPPEELRQALEVGLEAFSGSQKPLSRWRWPLGASWSSRARAC